MRINRFVADLPLIGQVPCYYKYDSDDRVCDVGIALSVWATAFWEKSSEDERKEMHDTLMQCAVTHHEEVIHGRPNKGTRHENSHARLP